MKKATKVQNCGIRNEGWGHKFALKLSLVDIQVLNHPYIIKYIRCFQTISLNKHVSDVPLVA